MKRLIIILSSAFLLTACSFDGGFRYSCQNPDNWEKAECNPPLCEPNGTCTKDLIGGTTP